ncbi:FecR family protein [Pseudomonas sp. ok272]|uniref:FecR family protein n=1 Tax=unclassified Pseudomonas TaxID=196821 RepID=UPI0008C0AF0D|nr:MULTISPECIES: FecR domain-containing protein [unclassified Pseudomonas]SEM63520.1 FecR family protein [Pseudomonas sp. ok272]SFM46414.1 FecR family protein [Pseudomonas sp. ok602]
MTPITSLHCRRFSTCLLLVAGLLGSLTQSAHAASLPAKRLPYIDDNQQCRGQPLPATIEHLSGEAWKLDHKGQQVPLEEGMSVDEQEGVKTSPSAFVSLSLGDGSRIVLPSSSQVRLTLNEELKVAQVILEQGQVESYVIKRASDYDRFQIVTPVGVLGVRGTHFRVRNDDKGQSLVEVLNGQVAVDRTEDTDQPAKKPGDKSPRQVGAGDDEVVQVMARQGLRIQKEGKLTPTDLLPAPQLLGQAGQTGRQPVWQLIIRPMDGATRYRAQVATDTGFLNILQEQFSSTPEINFSGLKAFNYHVRLSAFDDQGLEGETGVYDIFYYPRTLRVQ